MIKWLVQQKVGESMASGMRILVVDDEAQIRKLLRVALNAHGYDIEEVGTRTVRQLSGQRCLNLIY